MAGAEGLKLRIIIPGGNLSVDVRYIRSSTITQLSSRLTPIRRRCCHLSLCLTRKRSESRQAWGEASLNQPTHCHGTRIATVQPSYARSVPVIM
ncbi:hypothetical protein [Paenibacillus sp. BJ-4]|uniref:hypothetical protein n=1 Tax=Paenibacillus sp. BJ-4 TaxID=2878097 RepID=UPI001CEFB92F|nr:hypothetical protein [Paenibacillus sp. BJ-4]